MVSVTVSVSPSAGEEHEVVANTAVAAVTAATVAVTAPRGLPRDPRVGQTGGLVM
jgi:hypothetical protein